jgi:hypothetical protein
MTIKALAVQIKNNALSNVPYKSHYDTKNDKSTADSTV